MAKQADQRSWQDNVTRGGGPVGGSRSIFLGALSLLAKFATVAAIALALAVSAYALATQLWPWQASRIPLLGINPETNLVAGAVFFWLELFAVVGGIRLYDRVVQRDETHRRLRRLETIVNQLDEELYDARIAFATTLDEGKRADGTYAVDMIALNIAIAELRQGFLVKQLTDPRLTDHSRLVIDRVLRALDYMVEQTSQIGRAANDANLVTPAAVGPDDGAQSAQAGTHSLPELEERVQALLDASSPYDAGLNDTINQLVAANKRLLPSKAGKKAQAGGRR